jgi:hypothetical protein
MQATQATQSYDRGGKEQVDLLFMDGLGWHFGGFQPYAPVTVRPYRADELKLQIISSS